MTAVHDKPQRVVLHAVGGNEGIDEVGEEIEEDEDLLLYQQFVDSFVDNNGLGLLDGQLFLQHMEKLQKSLQHLVLKLISL